MSNKLTQFKPGQVANPKGRPKGSGNKIAERTKAAFVEVFEAIDPVELLHDWALNQPVLFKDMWKAMLPKDITLDANLKHQVERIERVIIDTKDTDSKSLKAANNSE